MELTLGRRIANLRKEKNLKQDELAEMLGVSPQAVSKWENDLTCPDISLLPKLAQILSVSVDELLSGKEEPPVKILPVEQRKDLKDMLLRIMIDSHIGDKMRVNLPVALVQVALDMGMEMPQFLSQSSDSSTNESIKAALNRIDLRQIMELIHHGAIGNIVELESSEGDTIRIFVE